MNSFENEYLKIINEANNFKVIYLPSEIKKFNFKSFTPFEYKGVSIFQSSMRDDINHVIERLNERTNNTYTLNDIFVIVKRGIDEFLNLVKTQKFNSKQSFNIISKSYPNIKVICAIEKNLIKNELIYLNEADDHPLFYNDYFCFIYTILLSSMKKHDIDKNLFVEANENLIYEIIVD
jgi:hypothetical protein